MRRSACWAVALVLFLVPAAMAQGGTLSHSTDSVTITPLNSVSCNAGGIHVDNGYFREYDLTDPMWGLTGPITIDSVTYGVEVATCCGGMGGTQPAEIRLYVNPTFPGPLGGAAACVIATHCEQFMVPDAAGALMTQTITPPLMVDPATDTVVIEFFTPDGTAGAHSFFFGSNPNGQTDLSYIAAAGCGLPDPTDLAAIGFPTMHMILDLNYSSAGPPPPTCTVAGPVTCTQGAVALQVDAMSMLMPNDMTITLEYSPMGLMTFLPCTMTVTSPNPNPTILAPPGIYDYEWDSTADGAALMGCEFYDILVTVIDTTTGAMSTCTTMVEVDNGVGCTVSGPPGCVLGSADLQVNTINPTGNDMTVTLEWSTLGAMVFNPMTMTVTSANPNPTPAAMVGLLDYQWDAAADGAGAGGCEIVDVRVTVVDNVTAAVNTCATTVEVDTSQICALCGDCNLSGLGPDIIDALTAAQIAAGLIVPMPTQPQTACCDVNTSGSVDVLDALLMAQAAAGLPVVLMCV